MATLQAMGTALDAFKQAFAEMWDLEKKVAAYETTLTEREAWSRLCEAQHKLPRYDTVATAAVDIQVAPPPKTTPEGCCRKKCLERGLENSVSRFRIARFRTMAKMGAIEGTDLNWKIRVDDLEFVAKLELPVTLVLKKTSKHASTETFDSKVVLKSPAGAEATVFNSDLSIPHPYLIAGALAANLERFTDLPEFTKAFDFWKGDATAFERGRGFAGMMP